mgnify:CR=1 FL=1
MATETAVDVVMPQMGVSVSEGTITKWLKQEGEQIEADEPLLEISTDKVDTEVPSPALGDADADPRPGGRDRRRRDEARADRRQRRQRRPCSARQLASERPGQPRRPRRLQPRRCACETRSRRAAAEPRPRAACAGSRRRNGKAFVSPVVARIAVRARRRSDQVAGHRPRRPRHEEGHPRLHRVRRRASSSACSRAGLPQPASGRGRSAALPARPKLPPPAEATRPAPVAAGETLLRRDSIDAAMRRGIAEHMRRSLDTAAHVHERDRGRHVATIVAAREHLKKEYQATLRRQPDLPRVRRARRGRDAARLPVRQRASCAATRSSRATSSTSASPSSSRTARA